MHTLGPTSAKVQREEQMLLTFLAGMTIHVCLQRTGTSEALVTNFAFVFFLCT